MTVQQPTIRPDGPAIRLVALDLDGTLLDPQKRLSSYSRQTLTRAAARGVEIVPATGRLLRGIPEAVRSLPFLRYAITINGACVQDARTGEALAREEMPCALAVDLLAYLESLGVPCDCYMGDTGWMTASLLARAETFAPDEYFLRTIRELRQPVPELKSFLLARGQDVQKVQAYFPGNPALRRELLETLETRFPGTAVSTSVPGNIEINSRGATKGVALGHLAAHLGLTLEQTMAVGDGLNDMSMIRAAGVGVAMQNACPELLAAADAVTGSCEDSGAAKAVERFCLT